MTEQEIRSLAAYDQPANLADACEWLKEIAAQLAAIKEILYRSQG